MRRGDKKPGDLQRPQGNDLQTNYEKHDIGEAEFLRRMDALGMEVDDWGIDMRGDDGSDGIIYDDKMDFRVYDDGELVALVDVKTKSSEKYMGMFNERHYVKYHEHATSLDVPTFVVMFKVDYSDEEVLDGFVFEIGGELYDGVRVSSEDEGVETFSDGNHKALIEEERREDWSTLEETIET